MQKEPQVQTVAWKSDPLLRSPRSYQLDGKTETRSRLIVESPEHQIRSSGLPCRTDPPRLAETRPHSRDFPGRSNPTTAASIQTRRARSCKVQGRYQKIERRRGADTSWSWDVR